MVKLEKHGLWTIYCERGAAVQVNVDFFDRLLLKM